MQAIARQSKQSSITIGRRSNFVVESIVLFVALLTILASYNRESITRLEETFEPHDNGPVFASYEYDDQHDGGQSTVATNGTRPLSWLCDIRKSREYAYCGFGLIFDQFHTGRGIDLSEYDSAIVSLHYEGAAKSLRFAIKDKNPHYAELGAPDDEKVNQVNMPVHPGAQTLSFHMDEFAVAEWWQEAADHPSTELSRPRFENVTAVEFVTSPDSIEGRQVLIIDRIDFRGHAMSAEQWYAGVAVAWLFLICSILALRRREVSKWQRELVETMRATVDTIPHMVWSLDNNGKISLNKRWSDFTGYPIGLRGWLELRQLIHPDDARSAIRQWRKGLRREFGFNVELRLRHHLGPYRWVSSHAMPLRAANGIISGWYGTCTDIHEQKLAQDALQTSIKRERKRSLQLKWTSEHDPLTRLPNRRAFEARLNQAIGEVAGAKSEVGLLLVDMDYFKHTNDTLGHAAGDELLKAISVRLRRSVRREDFVARIGGDEFSVILPNLQSPDELEQVGQKVASAIQKALTIEGYVVRPSASVGGARCSGETLEASDFLKRADAALYALKQSGRGGFAQFESHMLDNVKKAAFQLARAREAIVDDSIIAVYQPKQCIESGGFAGFEALLRLRTQDGELGRPDMLAEAFNDYELAAKIGEAMQNRVARDIRTWIDEGAEFGRISINAAPAEFLRNDYAERLLDILDRYRVPPHCVEVEVTEHAFVELGWEYVARALDRLKETGIAVSLDDFGTGHSSLTHIRDFPVDLIKIDRSYTKLITEDGAIASLVAGLVHLARSLRLKVVAEGVETPQQFELLRVMGCHFAQGHLHGHPIEAGQMSDFIAGKAMLRSAPGHSRAA